VISRVLLALLLLPACLTPNKDEGFADDSTLTGDDSDGPGDDTSSVDADGDGYTAMSDCDDDDAAVFPGAEEVCNGVDDDCNGEVDDECGCAHDVCDTGVPLDASCDSCVLNVCAADSVCCDTLWDSICVQEVSYFCAESCTCDHGFCVNGPALDPACDPCVDTVCLLDAFCCATAWDATCIGEAVTFCGAGC